MEKVASGTYIGRIWIIACSRSKNRGLKTLLSNCLIYSLLFDPGTSYCWLEVCLVQLQGMSLVTWPLDCVTHSRSIMHLYIRSPRFPDSA